MRPGIPGGMEDKMAKGLWDEAAERVLKAETYEQAIDAFAFEEALAWRYDWVSDEKLARNVAAKWDKTAKEILEDVVALRRKRTEDIEAGQEVVLAEDCPVYADLSRGRIIPFEMRGRKRPMCPIDWLRRHLPSARTTSSPLPCSRRRWDASRPSKVW